MIMTSNVNKFTYPILFRRGYWKTITQSWKKKEINWFSEEKKVLGRWNLKHNENDLNKFYQYLPDPGYPNNYNSLTISVVDSSPQYNHLGKPQN